MFHPKEVDRVTRGLVGFKIRSRKVPNLTHLRGNKLLRSSGSESGTETESDLHWIKTSYVLCSSTLL